MTKVLPSPHRERGEIQVGDREILQVHQGTEVSHAPGMENSGGDPRNGEDRPLELHLLDERQ